MSEEKRKFKEAAVSPDEQVTLLKKRGLSFANESFAQDRLEQIGIHRLSDYMQPYLQVNQPDGQQDFIPGTSFEQVMDTYSFDRKLRLTMLGPLEQVELAFKSLLTNEMCVPFGPHWYTDCKYFISNFRYREFLRRAIGQINLRRSPSLRQYFKEYGSPCLPPFWIVCELFSFGEVSRLYRNIHLNHRKAVSQKIGLPAKVAVPWIHCMSVLRNCCAHHAMIWNRAYTIAPFEMEAYKEDLKERYRFSAQATVLQLMLLHLCSDNGWTEELKGLFNAHPGIDPKVMGFEANWHERDIWQGKIVRFSEES